MKLISYDNLAPSEVIDGLDLPVHWRKIRFRHLFSFDRGLGITKADLKDEGIPCVNYGEIHSRLGFEVIPEKDTLKYVDEDYLETGKKSLLQNGDFVFADTSEDLEGSGNFTYLNSDETTFAGYHTVVARLQSDDIPRFLAYLFHSEPFRTQIRQRVTGVKVFSVTQAILKSCFIWLPPKEEQQLITNFLDIKTKKIDLLIEKKQKIIKLLKAQRSTLIKKTTTTGLDSNVTKVDSEIPWLGEIPNHWKVKRLKFLANIKNGCDYKHVEVPEYEDGYPVYGSGGAFRKANSYLSEGPSLLFGRKGTIDKPILVQGKFWTVDTMFYSIINDDVVPEYLYYLALYFEYAFISTQTALPSITQSDLGGYFVCLPPYNEQKEISQYLNTEVSKIDSLISVNEGAIEQLVEYRTINIHSAVTGKIDLRDIEIPEEH
ncbi:restriction endonuclease subunit S [Pseudoalteromonas sp. SR44-8]|uniref:restriction endonuclease subunit S n=1 Tax=Pseudoalteromonas sp. SR44-8 TaxID=2760933 RepID=UPI001603B2F3|nr:restriction endonuclease subunit S [Pseudoalteromonas sp. SR44-8]MBB1303035.1 restriction endonuclease subunit S [Pseudoalteromonas sp. SR44-8]